MKSSFWSSFKRLDVYRDIPSDLTNQTTVGAGVSVVAALLMMYLFLTEFGAFLAIRTVSEMYVDSPRDTQTEHAMIQINLNITVHQLPCAVLSVDAQDIMGTHVVDVGGKLEKSRLDAEGNLKRDVNGNLLPPEASEDNPAHEQIGEGCNVHGYLRVKKVPGNFHVSCHAHADLVHIFFENNVMNISHHIHHLSFGDEVRVDAARATNPLNDVRKIVLPSPENSNGEDPVSYEYYIKIVPTVFESLDGTLEHSYQFVANSNEINGHYRLPAVYFRYDMSPITMKIKETKTTLPHFFVQICAIVGGVFTVLGILNSVLNSSLKHVLAKADINKLG